MYGPRPDKNGDYFPGLPGTYHGQNKHGAWCYSYLWYLGAAVLLVVAAYAW